MPYILTYVAIVLGTAIVALRRPAVALALVLCLFGLEQWAQSVHPLFARYNTLTNIAVGSVLVFTLCVDMFRRGHTFDGYPKVGWLVLALFAYAFVSAQWAPYQADSLAQWSKAWPYLITIVVLSPLIIKTPDDIGVAFKALLLIGAVLAVLLIFTSRWEHNRVILLAGLFGSPGNPLAVATMGGYVAIIAVLMNFKSRMNILLWFRWAVVAAACVLAIKTGSRGPFIFMAVAAVLFIPMSRSVRDVRAFFAVAISIIIMLFIVDWAYDVYRDLEDERWSREGIEYSLKGRVDMAVKMLGNWYSSPATIFFGLGNSASYSPDYVGKYVHIVPVEILAEEGLIGAVLYIAILIVTLLNIRRIYRIVRDDPVARGTLAGISALFFYEFLLSLKQGSLLGSLYMFAFSIIIGKFERQLNARQVKFK